MANMITTGLSQQQIDFCRYFEENLYNKHSATFDKIKSAGDLIGYKADTNCPSCAKNAWLELLNKYNSFLSSWERLKFETSISSSEAQKPPKNEIYTKYEETEANNPEEEIKPKKKALK